MNDHRTAADWHEFRNLQDAQNRRYERAGVGGGQAEHNAYYGHGEHAGAGVEERITPKKWMQWSRQQSFDDLPAHEQEWHHGYELGESHGHDADHADFGEMDRAHDQSPHPEHFYQGYVEGLNSAVNRIAVRVGYQPLPPDAGPAQRFARMLSEDMPGIIKMAHDSGDPEVVYHCFAGDTRYLTRDGVKTFAETVGTHQFVLTGDPGDPHGGFWMEAPIQELGRQQIWEVTLQRNGRTKVIRTTEGHRWLVRRPDRIVTTASLRPGHRLAHLRARQHDLTPDAHGIRMGFVFGDGAIQYRTAQTYGMATLWGPKRDLAKYFDEIAIRADEVTTDGGVTGLRYISGMKGFTKTLPSLQDEPEYLYGWLMGLIAADGSVASTGSVTLSSASLETLLHVRDIATVLGIGTYAPHSKMRTGYGDGPSLLHTLSFESSSLRSEFFLRDDQRARFVPGKAGRFGWAVRSVVNTESEETVYCALVHGTQSFALEDNVHTGNCPSCGSGQVIARSDGTIECGFCKMCFTVQVQPRHPAFPQTINGVPMEVPGMGPQWPGEEDAVQGDQMDQAALPPGQPGQEDQEVPDESPGADEADEEEDTDEDNANPFAKKSYRSTTGAALGHDDFLRHLAVSTASNRAKMIKVIRRKNGVR
jgi:hypothetical protein